MKSVHVLPGDRGHLQLAERLTNITLHNALERGPGGGAVPLLDMLGDVAIEQSARRFGRSLARARFDSLPDYALAKSKW
jgi:hypothetical protein